MKKSTLSAGDIIDARCTKCQHVTNHVIVAIAGDKPVKVQCNTCQGTHRYRPPEIVRQPPKPKRVSDVPAVKPEEWSDLENAKGNVAAKDYHMDLNYRVGSTIRHPNFGIGLVQRLCGNRKMEVLFESGKKIMRCGQ